MQCLEDKSTMFQRKFTIYVYVQNNPVLLLLIDSSMLYTQG